MKKLKMKDFDFKQFFIQKGEKVGLWVCVGILVLLVVLTVKDLLAVPSASANADELTGLAKKGKDQIVSSRPTDDVKVVPDQILKADSPVPVPQDQFATERLFFDGGATEDRKWRSPAVLVMDDSRVDYFPANVPSLILFPKKDEKEPPEVGVLVPVDNKGIQEQNQKTMDERKRKANRRAALLAQYLQQLQQMQPGMRGGAGGMGAGSPMGMRGGGMGGAPGMGGGPPGMGGPGGNMMQMMGGRMGGGMGAGMMDRMQSFGQTSMALGGEGGQQYKIVPASEDKVGNNELAEEIRPYRMVLISAAFPYKKQLEQFRQALRFPSIDKMLADNDLPGGLEFAGIYVQRRQGKPGESLANKPWEDIPIEAKMKQIMVEAIDPDKSEQDQELKQYGIILPHNRLVMPRPKLDDKLHKEDKYKYPDELPPSVADSLAAMKEANKGAAPPVQKKPSRLKDVEDYSIYGDDQSPSNAPDPNPQAAGAKREGTIQTTTEETPRPDKILVRFYDTSVEPGMNYQYRVQVRMANPNYKNEKRAVSKNITLDKEVRGAWAELPQTVRVPDELMFYAVDERRNDSTYAYSDRVAMQVHRWLERIQTDPNNRGSVRLVGDWSILERDWVRRGEYIGGLKETDVPIWWPTFKKYMFALHPDEAKKRAPGAPRTPRKQGVPIDFDTHALLVDFEGGKKSYQVGANKFVDESPIEVLVLNKGKLLVKESKSDTENEDRKKRVEEWKTTLKNVKEEVDNAKSPSGRPGSFDNLIGPGGKKGGQ